MKVFYVDTSIWRDLFENRKDNVKPLGEFAFMFCKKCIENNWTILISEFLIYELTKNLTKEQINSFLNEYKQILINVKTTNKELKQANTLSKQRKVSFGDVLHAILARNNNAVIVSRDKHFDDLRDIAECFKPEELI